MNDNYQAGKRQVIQTWIFEFDDEYEGSITINRRANGDFLGWRSTNPASTLANWDYKAHRVITEGTGDLKNFHLSDFDNNLGTRWWWGIGHFAPRD